MVEDSGTAAGSGGLRPLNAPIPTAVDATPSGVPRAVLRRGKLVPVARIIDRWRIDDEWWRAPIVRRYFLVELRDGQQLTLFHDAVHDAWYRQPYPAPVERVQRRGA